MSLDTPHWYEANGAAAIFAITEIFNCCDCQLHRENFPPFLLAQHRDNCRELASLTSRARYIRPVAILQTDAYYLRSDLSGARPKSLSAASLKNNGRVLCVFEITALFLHDGLMHSHNGTLVVQYTIED